MWYVKTTSNQQNLAQIAITKIPDIMNANEVIYVRILTHLLCDEPFGKEYKTR